MHSDTRRNIAEETPKTRQVVRLLLRERATTAGKWNIRIDQSREQSGPLAEDLRISRTRWKNVGDIVPKLEVDTRGDLVQALELAGLKRPSAESLSRKSDKSEITAARVDEWLNEADLVTQYAAIRSA